jgi:hypothetical protein
MSMIALACSLSYLLVHKTVWMWWILVIFGGLSGGVLLLHHLYMAVVMIEFVHASLNSVAEAFSAKPPKHKGNALNALFAIHHESTAKRHKDALKLAVKPEHRTTAWRPRLFMDRLHTRPPSPEMTAEEFQKLSEANWRKTAMLYID